VDEPASIFISYSHADKELARALYERLKARGPRSGSTTRSCALPRRGSPGVVIDVNALVARIETLTTEVAEHRLLAAQAESAAKTEASARGG
jgi:hypothetical protein